MDQEARSKASSIFGQLFLGSDYVKEDKLLEEEFKGHNIRKRYGELNVESGSNDPSWFLLLNWMFLAVVVGFVVQGGILLNLKLFFFDDFEAHHLQNMELLAKIEEKTILITNAKVFLDEYTAQNKILFHQIDLRQWMEDKIAQNNHLLDQLGDANEIYDCEEKNMFCQLPFSENVIEGEIKLILSRVYERKREFLEGMTQELDYKARFELFFAQQIVYYYARIQESKLRLSTQEMERMELQFTEATVSLMLISLVYSVLVLGCGCCVIRWKEQKYLRNIFLLSFLNSQMVAENKRIYSFIRRVEKQE